jgi:hypothetical protein
MKHIASCSLQVEVPLRELKVVFQALIRDVCKIAFRSGAHQRAPNADKFARGLEALMPYAKWEMEDAASKRSRDACILAFEARLECSIEQIPLLIIKKVLKAFEHLSH